PRRPGAGATVALRHRARERDRRTCAIGGLPLCVRRRNASVRASGRLRRAHAGRAHLALLPRIRFHARRLACRARRRGSARDRHGRRSLAAALLPLRARWALQRHRDERIAPRERRVARALHRRGRPHAPRASLIAMWNFPLHPPADSSLATRVDHLFYAWLGLAGVVTIAVFFLIVYFSIKYRHGSRASRAMPQGAALRRESHRIEFAWIVTPLVIFLGMGFWAADLYYAHASP